MKAALAEANKSPAEFLPKHAATVTYELAPGANTGHAPEFAVWPEEQKAAYEDVGNWAVEPPEMATQRLGVFGPSGEVPPEVGSGKRDVLYSALGMRQLPVLEGVGSYLNSAKQWENNKLYMPRPLVDFPTGNPEGRMSDLTAAVMDAVENTRGLVNAQEAYGFNLPNTMAAAPNKNSVLFETTGETPIGVQLREVVLEGRGVLEEEARPF